MGVFCYDGWVLNEGHKNLLQGLLSHELTAYLSVSNQFLTQWIMTILSKRCKPDNFESHNPLKLRFTDIWGIHLNFIEREFFLESNSPDIPALCVTNLDDSIDSGSFSVMGYYIDDLTVYVKEGCPFAQD